MFRSTLIAAALAATALVAHADPVVASYGSFGNLAGATFGGTDIPTNPAAITTANGITVALIANPRYSNAAPTNNGAGTYYAQAGLNDGLNAPGAHPLGTTWNFGFYVNLGTGNASNYNIDVFYDLDPTAGTELSQLGRIDIDAILGAGAASTNLIQDTQALNFAYLSTGVPGAVFAPGGSFNPDAAGEYAFVVRVSARDPGNTVLALSSILVNVEAVPEPGSLALAGVALLALVGNARRRKA